MKTCCHQSSGKSKTKANELISKKQSKHTLVRTWRDSNSALLVGTENTQQLWETARGFVSKTGTASGASKGTETRIWKSLSTPCSLQRRSQNRLKRPERALMDGG